MAKTKSEEKHGIDPDALSELELTLTVLWNSVRRWMGQRSNSSTIKGLSDTDVFLLHLLVYRNRQLKGADLAFALSIEDMHLVSYSLKKLTRLGLTTSEKRAKRCSIARPTLVGSITTTSSVIERCFLNPPSISWPYRIMTSKT